MCVHVYVRTYVCGPNLQLLADGCNDGVDRDHQEHDSKAGKDGRAEREPEEDKRQHDLQGSGPDHVDVGHEVHEALGIDGHEVDYLSHGLRTTSLVAHHQCLH